MKKIRKIAIVMMGVLALVACKKTNPDAAGPEAVTKQLSPEEVSDYLNGTVQEVLNTFKATDQQAVIEVIDRFTYEFANNSYNFDAFINRYGDGRYESIWKVAQYISAVGKGDVMATPPASDFVFSLNNESAIFEADDVTRCWVYKGAASDGSTQIIYKYGQNNSCVFKLWGEGSVKTYEIDVPDINKHYTAYVPERIIFAVIVNGVEQVRLTVKIDLELNDHYNLAMEGRLANINWNFDIKVATTHASFKANFLYGSESLLAFEAAMPSYVTLDKQSNETWEDWIGRYGKCYEELIQNIGSVEGCLNFKNRVQIKGGLKNGGEFYTAFMNWEKKFGNENSYEGNDWWNAPCNRKGAKQEQADIYNNYMNIGVYFNSDILQVQLKVDVKNITDEIYDYSTKQDVEISYYETNPVLFFPQNSTSYEFNNYITKERFGNVLNWTENLINSYIELFKYNEIGKITFGQKN